MFDWGHALVRTFVKDESLRGNSESLGVLKKNEADWVPCEIFNTYLYSINNEFVFLMKPEVRTSGRIILQDLAYPPNDFESPVHDTISKHARNTIAAVERYKVRVGD